MYRIPKSIFFLSLLDLENKLQVILIWFQILSFYYLSERKTLSGLFYFFFQVRNECFTTNCFHQCITESPFIMQGNNYEISEIYY